MTICFCPGPWPFTSALGDSTRRNSAGRANVSPVSNATFSVVFDLSSRSSVGQGLVRASVTSGITPLCVGERARFVGEHDGDAVADGIGEAGLPADQLLLVAVVDERRFGDRADERLEELRIGFHGR